MLNFWRALKIMILKSWAGRCWERWAGRVLSESQAWVSLMNAEHVTALKSLSWPQLIRAQLQHINSRWTAHRPWDAVSCEMSRPVRAAPQVQLFYTWQTGMRWKRLSSWRVVLLYLLVYKKLILYDTIIMILWISHKSVYFYLKSKERKKLFALRNLSPFNDYFLLVITYYYFFTLL